MEFPECGGVLMAFPYRHLLIPLTLAAAGVLLAASGVVNLPEADSTAVQEAEPDPAQQRLVRHLSRRFRIAPEATEDMVNTAYQAARHAGLDPLLVLAVIAVESRFNPIAESKGARGLMQIIPENHEDKLLVQGGDEAVLDPASNIRVGTQILQEYVHRTGTVEEGLESYNAPRASKARYAQRVLAERDRLERVAHPRPRGA
jgi:soluble lytic murein transglycosylase-like protein